MRKLYIIFFYAALLVFRSVAYPGFTTNLLSLSEHILNGYILRHSNRDFKMLAQTLTIYLKSQADLASNFVTDYRWFEKLISDRVISGAYVRDGIMSFTLGRPFIPEFVTESQFYIDRDGFIHYVFSDIENELFVDTIINYHELRYDLEKVSKNLEWLILYDEFAGTSSVLFQSDEEGEINFDSIRYSTISPVLLGLRSIQYASNLTMENSALVLVAQSRLMLSDFSLHLFGLIAIVILTILLLIFIIRFVFSTSNRGMGKRALVEERKKTVNIVNQIDDMLVPMKGAMQVSEKMKVTPKPSGRSDQLLAHDGIRIKRP